MKRLLTILFALSCASALLSQEAAQATTSQPATARDQGPAPEEAASASTGEPRITPPEGAANTAPASFVFHATVILGADVLPTGASAASEVWTRLGFRPEFVFGKFGLGLDLTMRFRFFPPGNPDQVFELYLYDWIPKDDKTYWDIYLTKLLYLRYGTKGEDPLFVKFGSIDSLSLGNGFVMGGYSNMRFLPELRILGFDAGLDAVMFKFPYIGFELMAANLSRFDVMGGRLFTRPLAFLRVSPARNMQLGFSFAGDRTADLYAPVAAGPASFIALYGIDLTIPVLGGASYPLTFFADAAFEPNNSAGGSLGLAGRIAGALTYGAQFRLFQQGFIPSYFDANYDLYRAKKYDFMQKDPGEDLLMGWYASLGFALLRDRLIFKIAMDGPFTAAPETPSDYQCDYPHAKVVLILAPGLLGGLSLDLSYEKYFIGRVESFFSDLIEAADMVLGFNVHYRTGASLVTLAFTGTWDPSTQNFILRSSLSASVRF